MPVGPHILWEEPTRKSTSSACTSTGMCGCDWQASRRTSAPAWGGGVRGEFAVRPPISRPDYQSPVEQRLAGVRQKCADMEAPGPRLGEGGGGVITRPLSVTNQSAS